MKKTKKRIRWELAEQHMLIIWLEKQMMWGRVLKFTAIPNSTWTPSIAERNRNSASGVRPGFPDLVVLLKNNLVCLEMKRPRREAMYTKVLLTSPSKVSPEQKEWIDLLNKYNPVVQAHVCYGAKHAVEILTKYIGDVSTPKTTNEERSKSVSEFHSFISGEKSM